MLPPGEYEKKCMKFFLYLPSSSGTVLGRWLNSGVSAFQFIVWFMHVIMSFTVGWAGLASSLYAVKHEKGEMETPEDSSTMRTIGNSSSLLGICPLILALPDGLFMTTTTTTSDSDSDASLSLVSVHVSVLVGLL